MNTKLVQNWCNQFKLCKGCRFVGNECVVKDGETGYTKP